MSRTGEEIMQENFKLREDIDALIEYIVNVTGRDFENCAVYEICKKYDE